MLDWLFGKSKKEHLGIDLGLSAIKMVELKKKDERLVLSNYAILQIKKDSAFKISDLKEEEIAKVLKNLIAKADIRGRTANISLPINQTFSTIIDFPEMSEDELAAAIPFEARKYVPVPLEEVVLDWSVVGRSALSKNNSAAADIKNPAASNQGEPMAAGVQNGSRQAEKGQLQVLLVAVPKEIINKIAKIARLAGLEVLTLEQESFSLVRALVGGDKSTFLIIDIGRKSSDIVVVDDGFIRLSHNLETIEEEILLMEIERLVNIFRVKYNKSIGSCLLTGGRAADKNIFSFLSKKLSIAVAIGDPFAKTKYEAALAPAIKDLGPELAVAVGLAMRE